MSRKGSAHLKVSIQEQKQLYEIVGAVIIWFRERQNEVIVLTAWFWKDLLRVQKYRELVMALQKVNKASMYFQAN